MGQPNKTMSNTPRTDRLTHAPNGNYFSASATDFRNLCYELERELAREVEQRQALRDQNIRLRALLKDARDDIERLDHGEDAPGMRAWQHEFVREVDAVLSASA